MAGELAPRDFWDQIHAQSGVPEFGRYRPERQLLEFFEMRMEPRAGQRLLEIGVGNTAVLPGLARRFGYQVAGLDYSPVGVELARRNLVGLDADIREADFFNPPQDWIGVFDVVTSFGVVEHFDDTAAAIQSCALYARRGGSVLTLVPNMRGLPGYLQRRIDRRTFDRHVPLSAVQLARAHRRAELQVVWSGPVGSFHGSVVNDVDASRLGHLAYRALWKMSRVLWALEERTITLPWSSFASPWIVCVATR